MLPIPQFDESVTGRWKAQIRVCSRWDTGWFRARKCGTGSSRSKKVSARARRHSNFRAGGEARRGACSTHPRLHPDGVGGLDGTQLINDRRGSAGVWGCIPHPCTPSIRLTVNGVRIDASRTGPRAVKARRGPIIDPKPPNLPPISHRCSTPCLPISVKASFRVLKTRRGRATQRSGRMRRTAKWERD